MARPTGEAGVSTISSAAGRNSSSARRAPPRRSGTTLGAAFAFAGTAADGAADASASDDFVEAAMVTRLHAIEGGVAPAGAQQVVVLAVLDDAAALDRDDAVGERHRGEAVRDDQHGAAL